MHLLLLFIIILTSECHLISVSGLFLPSDLPEQWPSFEDPRGNLLANIVVYNETGDVFVAGLNVLYHLGPDLNMIRNVTTGPELDHPDCLHLSFPCAHKRFMVDNTNRVLKVVPQMEPPMLLVCGSLYRGLCQVRPIEDISRFYWVGPLNGTVNLISTKGGNTAVFAPGYGGQLSLFSGTTYLAEKNLTYTHPFVSSRVLVQEDGEFRFKYSFASDTSVSALLFKGATKRGCIHSFIHRGYIYFVMVYTEPQDSHTALAFRSKLGRVCLEDGTFHSYTEIPFNCTFMGEDCGRATAAYLGPVRKSFRTVYTHPSSKRAMYVNFVQMVGTRAKASIIFEFNMLLVEDFFMNATFKCGDGLPVSNLLQPETGNLTVCHKLKKEQIVVGAYQTCNSDYNPYIVGNIPVRGAVAAYIQGIYITALVVVVQNDETVIFGGMTNKIVKIHLEMNGRIINVMQFSKSGTYKTIPRSLALDQHEKHIYFLIQNSVLKYPVRTCSLFKSCDSCLTWGRRDPLGCGWCEDRCAPPEDCKDMFSRTICPPIIHSVYPPKVPTSGGSSIILKGENFGLQILRRTTNEVTVGHFACDIVSWGNYEITFVVPRVNGLIEYPVTVKVLDNSNSSRGYDYSGEATSSAKISFVEPKLTGVNPDRGPMSGGTNVTLVGADLDAGRHQVIIMMGRKCVDVGFTSNVAWCITGSLNGVVFSKIISIQMEVAIITLDPDATTDVDFGFPVYKTFEYVPDPEIFKIDPAVTTLSGLVNLTVSGMHLDSVLKPDIIVTTASSASVQQMEFRMPCQLKLDSNGTEMICTTPSLNILRGPIPTERQPVVTHVTFFMDGIRKMSQEKDSILLYYPDPEYKALKELKKIRFDEEPILEIQGSYLNLAHSQNDFEVKIGGDELCNITVLYRDYLQCTLPPQIMRNASTRGTNFSIEISLHSAHYLLGYLQIVEPEKAEEQDPLSWEIYLVIFIIAVTVFSLILWMYCRRVARRKREEIILNSRSLTDYVGVPLNENDTAFIEPKFIDDETLLLLEAENRIILKEHLTCGEVIGEGCFGLVLEGYLKRPGEESSKVAVKTIKNTTNPSKLMEEVANLLEEALLMKDFDHPNVLKLLGVCLRDQIPLVVLPFMENGNLLKYLKSEDSILYIPDQLQFAIDVANGMLYLSEKKFIHRDLAARNCILDENKSAKVADFGLSRDIYVDGYYDADRSKKKLPYKWMAMESIENDSYSKKSDVWSYGVLLWEIMTRGMMPYPAVENSELIIYLKRGNRLPQPQKAPESLYIIMLACWIENPKKRPEFDQLLECITFIKDNLQESAETFASPTTANNNVYLEYTGEIPEDSSYLEMNGPILRPFN